MRNWRDAETGKEWRQLYNCTEKWVHMESLKKNYASWLPSNGGSQKILFHVDKKMVLMYDVLFIHIKQG